MACEKSADASLAPPRHAWQQMSAAQPLVFPCAHYILYSGSPRIRALLPAFAGGTFVNGPRKTNTTFGVACFSFGLIITRKRQMSKLMFAFLPFCHSS